jgi:type IV secretion system protein VirD4
MNRVSNENAVLLGRETDTGRAIALGQEGHLLTIAPTGAGKGVSALIPALLTYPGQAIVLDCKGEAVAVTRRYREQVLGQTVVVLDPFGVTGAPACRLNPFDLLPADPVEAGPELLAFSELLAPGHPETSDPYWGLAGRQLICGLLAHYVSCAGSRDRNIAGLLDLMARMLTDAETLAREMAHSGIASVRTQAQLIADSRSNHDTARDVVSHAATALSGLRGRATSEATAATDFDLEALRRGDPMTIYLVVPPNRLQSGGRLLRLWVGMLSSLLMGRRQRPEHSTLLLIDEAAQLGQMELFVTAMTLYRGYGIQCWSFWQDFSQLQSLYPWDWQTIVNNAAAVQAFGPSCISMAMEFRHLMPGSSAFDLLSMKRDSLLLARAGEAGRIVRRIDYLKEDHFLVRADPNPYYVAAA